MRLLGLGSISLLAAAACGGGDDGPPVPAGDYYYYVADGVQAPSNTQEVTTLGLDLDSDEEGGDEGVDNQLGNVLSALGGFGFDIQAQLDEAVDTGSVILLARFQTTSFSSAGGAGITVYLGDNPNPPACMDASDMVCRKHLTGTAMFGIDPASPTDALVAGRITNSTFKGGPGTLTLQIALAAGNPITLNLIGARSEIRGLNEATLGEGKLAGAIPNDDIQNNIIPAVASQLGDTLVDDCGPSPRTPPTCGCTASSTGEQLISLFDKPMSADCPSCVQDCEITVGEIRENNIIRSFLDPDVTIDGVDALSLGIGFTAVGAVFTAP
jgi:hypothetical protein